MRKYSRRNLCGEVCFGESCGRFSSFFYSFLFPVFGFSRREGYIMMVFCLNLLCFDRCILSNDAPTLIPELFLNPTWGHACTEG